MFVVGVDGCRTGWLAVTITREGAWEVEVFPTFGELWGKYRGAALVLVDIPIGLKEGGSKERLCDKKARKILGTRKSSVFPVPCRSAVYRATYDGAIKENVRLTGKSIFKAVWRIMPKIREVDELLLTERDARNRVRESHPEVCFWALNGGVPMTANKKTGQGSEERRLLLLQVLSPVFSDTQKLLAAGASFKPQKVAPDDVLDALALATTALLGQQGLATIPPEPERDPQGLPMEMVHLPVGKKI